MTVIDFGKQPEEERPLLEKLSIQMVLIVGILFGGAIAWAVIGYLSESVYFIIALFIGLGFSRVIAAPFYPLNFTKGVIILVSSIFLSLLCIVIGEFLFSVIYLIYKWNYPVIKAINIALANIGDVISSVDAIFGYAFGIIGAIAGLIISVREIRNIGELQ